MRNKYYTPRQVKVMVITAILFTALVALAFMASPAEAYGYFPWSPDGVSAWFIDDEGEGLWCVTDQRSDGPHTTCYCPCESGYCEFSPEPTVSPTGENPVPSETPKPKCNSGRGNDSEGDPDCDPGNSGGHNQGGD